MAAFIMLSIRNSKIITRLGEEIAAERKIQNVVSELFNSTSAYQAGKDHRIYDMKHIIDLYRQRKLDVIKKNNKKYWNSQRNLQIPEVLLSHSLTFLIYAFVGINALIGVFAIGGVILYVGFIQRFVTAVRNLTTEISAFCMNETFLNNYLDFYQNMHSTYKGCIATQKSSTHEIIFHNVSFKYPGAQHYAIKNLSLKLRVGKTLAVVGMNGSGKTTMIKLLCRLYDPTDGKITLNGIDIREYDYNHYMALFAVVFQDFELFSFSLGQNIAASAEYDSKYAEQCLISAGFADRFAEMPKGLETPIYKDFAEDGVEISGGEAQKIALARALYKNAPFVVLDEPTAALDPMAEFELYSRFNTILSGKTAIYISHRLSSCRFCDDIAVFDNGQLIQNGSHNALVSNKKGKYYELWTAQAQYYV